MRRALVLLATLLLAVPALSQEPSSGERSGARIERHGSRPGDRERLRLRRKLERARRALREHRLERGERGKLEGREPWKRKLEELRERSREKNPAKELEKREKRGDLEKRGKLEKRGEPGVPHRKAPRTRGARGPKGPDEHAGR